MNHTDTFKKYALSIPEVLLPKDKSDLSRWAVIACDQFTQDRDYWKKVASYAGDKPSTLNIILPEVYLEEGGRAERLANIRTNMKNYLGGGIFAARLNPVTAVAAMSADDGFKLFAKDAPAE